MVKKSLTIFLSLFTFVLFAQDSSEVIKTKYVQIDRIDESFNNIFNEESESIEFVLVELTNLNTSEVLYGVEVNIRISENEVIAKSLGLTFTSSLWANSSNVTYRNIQESGSIFMDLKDLQTVIEFFNESMGMMGNIEDERYRVLKLTLYNRFDFGFLYDREWKIIISVDDATYTLDYRDGIDMVKKLNDFKKYIEENQ